MGSLVAQGCSASIRAGGDKRAFNEYLSCISEIIEFILSEMVD